MKFDFFSRCSIGRHFTTDDNDPGCVTGYEKPVRPDPCRDAAAPGNASLTKNLSSSCIDAKPETHDERLARLREQVRDGSYEVPFSHLVRILAALLRGKH